MGIGCRDRRHSHPDPAWTYDDIAESWISPNELFRPCADQEINDTACELKHSRGGAFGTVEYLTMAGILRD